MTNKTKAATEEAAKLPTAYQTLNNHLSRVGLTLATAHESILLDAIESHTAAHTAALRSDIKQLQRLLENSLEVGEELRERVSELETSIDLLHMEIHVLITNARVTLTKLGIAPDKSEAADRLFYDLDVEQGKLMDSIGDKIKSILK